MLFLNLLLIAAVLPPVILLLYIWKLDSIEKEPPGLLAKLFIFGCIITVGALILESLGEAVMTVVFGDKTTVITGLIMYFIVVAWSEEGLKRLVLRRVTWKNPAFDYRFDAIVYAVFVSLGFAALENVVYVFGGGLPVAGIRAVTAIPLHAIAGVFMGHYYGEAKLAEVNGDHSSCRKYMFLSLLIPILIHGFYDFAASSESLLMSAIFFAFVIVIEIFAFKRVRKYAAADMSFDRLKE